MKICKCCGIRKCTSAGGGKLLNYCYSCKTNKWARHKKTYCEFCGFIAVNIAQLDVDHIDGDKRNNLPTNLQTLCANCHRLKTIVSGDNLKTKKALNASPQTKLF